MKLSADTILTEACDGLGISLVDLVAAASLWASPEVFQALTADGGCWYPNCRRYKVGGGERKGQVLDGVRLDDNTYANYAIKRAVGFQHAELEGFAVCHVWPGTTYDQRYHTCIANLVLLPAPLAGLTDHHKGVEDSMKYRAYELYRWHPEGVQPPPRPSEYPEAWREPLACSDRVRKFLRNRKSSA